MIRFKLVETSQDAIDTFSLWYDLLEQIQRGDIQAAVENKTKPPSFDLGYVFRQSEGKLIAYMAVYPLSYCENCMHSAIMRGLLPDDATCAGCTGEGPGST